MYPLTVAVLIANPNLRDEAFAVLRDLPVRIVLDFASPKEGQTVLAALQRDCPDVVLVDLTSPEWSCNDFTRSVRAASAGSMLIAMHTSADPDTILSAIRAGANEYLYPPLASNLERALERKSEQTQADQERPRGGGRILGILSAKGGCGATTVACHLAAELGRLGAGHQQKTLLADLDLEAGIVGFLMKSMSGYSIADAVHNLHRLDLSYWKALVSNGWPGLEVITVPRETAERLGVKHEAIREVLAFVRGQYNWSVLDLGRGLNAMVLSAMPELDEIYLITNVEVPALHQAKQVVQGLLDRDYAKERLRLMLNRTPQPGTELSADEIERILGIAIHGLLPNDYAALDDCYCEGKLLPPVSNLGRQIARLAMQVAGIPEEKSKRRFRLFG